MKAGVGRHLPVPTPFTTSNALVRESAKFVLTMCWGRAPSGVIPTSIKATAPEELVKPPMFSELASLASR